MKIVSAVGARPQFIKAARKVVLIVLEQHTRDLEE
jgi:hypothetical protein